MDLTKQGFKDWGMVLSPTFRLDRASYLLATMVPFAYSDYSVEPARLLIDLSAIATPKREEGIKLLEDAGYIKVNRSKGYAELGTMKNFSTPLYHFNSQDVIQAAIRQIAPNPPILVTSAQEVATVSGEPEKMVTMDAISQFKESLFPMVDNYGEYCASAHRLDTYETVKKKLANLFSLAGRGREWESKDLIDYFNCILAAAYQHTVFMNAKSVKDSAIAKAMLREFKTEFLLEYVAFFIQEYAPCNPKLQGVSLAALNGFKSGVMLEFQKSKRGAKKIVVEKIYTED